MHYLLLLIRHKREPEERTELYELVAESVQSRRAEEVRAMARTDAQVLMAQGRREGRTEAQSVTNALQSDDCYGRRVGPMMNWKFTTVKRPEVTVASCD